jgi:hypothetical protein
MAATTAAGMAMFPMSRETDGLDSRTLTMADLRLDLRAGRSGSDLHPDGWYGLAAWRCGIGAAGCHGACGGLAVAAG